MRRIILAVTLLAVVGLAAGMLLAGDRSPNAAGQDSGQAERLRQDLTRAKQAQRGWAKARDGATQRVLERFTLTSSSRAFACDFTAVKDGVHTAAVKGTSGATMRLQVASSGASPKSAIREGGAAVEFDAQAGSRYTITVDIAPGTKASVKGELCVVYGRGPDASKRPLNPAKPMDPAAIPSGPKNALIPLVVQLAKRYLSNARDKNELDRAFDRAQARSRRVKRQALEKLVAAYDAIPADIRARRFEPITPGKSNTAPVTAADVRRVFKIPPKQPLPATRRPQIQTVRSKTPAGRFSPGQEVVIRGRGFSKAATRNLIVLTPKSAGKSASRFSRQELRPIQVRPHAATATQLAFYVPKALVPGTYTVHTTIVYQAAQYDSNQIQFIAEEPVLVSPPRPVISSVSPRGQEPGQWVYINGENLYPGSQPRVRFTSLDAATPREFTTTPSSASGSQWRVPLPRDVISGNYGIQVSCANGLSDGAAYEMATPKYRIIFQEIKCLDESDPEWAGDDEIVTIWGVIGDLSAFAKSTDEYEGFDDGKVQNYKPGDRNVLTPDGDWAEVQYALALTTKLYEWDAGDVEAITQAISIVGDVAEGILDLAGEGAAADIVKSIFDQLDDAINIIASWLGGDPDKLGEREQVWSAAELQPMLPGAGESKDQWLNFRNDDDTGSYRLHYKIYRQ